MKKIPGYIAGAIIAIIALIPPTSKCLYTIVNSTLWLWMVLCAGFLGLYFAHAKANICLRLLIIWCFINCFLSRAPYLSFTMYTSVIACVYFYLLCKKIDDFDCIFKVIQSIFLLSVLLIVAQCFRSDTLLNFHRPDKPVILGTIGNPMVLGSFIVCLGPFLLAYRKLHIVPLFLVAWISGSAGTILALTAGVMFYLNFKIKNKIIYAVLLLASIAGLWCYGVKDSAVEYFNKGGRGMVWKRTIKLANERWLTGHGISTYRVLFPVLAADLHTGNSPSWKYEGTQGNRLPWRRTHNCWLQFDFETGRPGSILFAGFLGSLLLLFIKARKTEPVVIAMTGLIIVGTDMTIHFPTRLEQAIPVIICFLAYFTILMITNKKEKQYA